MSDGSGPRSVRLPVDEARRRFAAARVARLATADAEGRPHLVPITFAMGGPDLIHTAVDAKPKRSAALRRLANIAGNPAVSVLVDHYEEDWSALWWVRADGTARVLSPSDPEAVRAAEALAARYEAFALVGDVIAIDVTHWSSWSASA